MNHCSEAFKPTLMEYNADVGPTQVTQKYFWGGHGGVGGGDSREEDCSRITLRFLLKEMEERGLSLAYDQQLVQELPDIQAPTIKPDSNPLMAVIGFFTGKFVRPIKSIEDLHLTAVKRYRLVEDWRPKNLGPLRNDILGDSDPNDVNADNRSA